MNIETFVIPGQCMLQIVDGKYQLLFGDGLILPIDSASGDKLMKYVTYLFEKERLADIAAEKAAYDSEARERGGWFLACDGIV